MSSTIPEQRYQLSITWTFPLQPSTKQTYSSAEKRFLEFCLLYRPPFGNFMPVDETTLVQYAAYLARSIRHSSPEWL